MTKSKSLSAAEEAASEKDTDNAPPPSIDSIKILGRELTATLMSFSTELLQKDEYLLKMIQDYVFNGAPNRELLISTLTRITKEIPSFHKDNLEILSLSLEGARMVVQENEHTIKLFDEYMIAKKFKVRERILAYEESKKPELKVASRNRKRYYRNRASFN